MKFNFKWSERREAVIEAEDMEHAVDILSSGDYDSDFLYEHDWECEVEDDKEVEDAEV